MAKPGELTPRQDDFVREYLIDRNGKQAAIRAGYAPASAEMQASRLLSLDKVKKKVAKTAEKVAAKTETDAEWVRRRLKEEADDFSEFASHSARIKAIELIAKLNGDFEKHNAQKATPLVQLALIMRPDIAGPGTFAIPESDD